MNANVNVKTASSPFRTPAKSADASPPNRPTPVTASKNTNAAKATKLKPKRKWLTCLTSRLAWVLANWTFAKWKPVLRCALVGWVSLVLFVIPAVEREMGQASILILTVAFLSPPSDPFLMMLEREILIIFFVCMAWAWACLGIFLANLSRNFHDPNVTLLEAATGQYIEAAPSIIMAVFIFFGSAFFLFVRARKGPGPYFVPTVLACICLDISFTTACIYPFPFYNSGRGVVLPVSMHSAACILASITVFPSTVSSLFTTRLVAVLSPLQEMLEKNIDLLIIGPYDGTMAAQVPSTGHTTKHGENRHEIDGEMFSEKETNTSINGKSASDPHLPTPRPLDPKPSSSYTATVAAVRALKGASEGALAPLASARRLLHSDLIYSRFAPGDFDVFHELSRKLAGRADGLGIYFELVEAGLSTSPDGISVSGPAPPGVDEVDREGGGQRGIGSGGGGMIKGAEGGPGSEYTRTPYPVGSKHRRVDSLPATLCEASTSYPSDTRTSARHRHPYTYGYVPNDAHSQFHFAQLRHSQSAPGLKFDSEVGVASRAVGERGGGDSSATTTWRTAPAQGSRTSEKDGDQDLFRSPTHHSMPLSRLEADSKVGAQYEHSPHRSFLPLARTLANITGRKHGHSKGHGHECDQDHDYVRIPRSFSKKAEWVVGTFESQRYMNLEATRMHDPRAEEWTRLTFDLLRESCSPLLGLCALGIKTTTSWLTNDVRSGRLKYLLDIRREEERERIQETYENRKQMRNKLQEGLRLFKKEKRHVVLNPYLQAFEHSDAPPSPITTTSPWYMDSSLEGMASATGARRSYFQAIEGATTNTVFTNSEDGICQGGRANTEEEFSRNPGRDFTAEPGLGGNLQDNTSDDECSEGSYTQSTGTAGLKDSSEMPPHRYLFNCYVYQYNLIQMASVIIQMLDEILRLEIARPEPKLWTPVTRLFNWTPWCVADSPDVVEMADDDYDPDIIQGSQKDMLQATNLERDKTGDPADTSSAASRLKMNVTTWCEPESESMGLGLPRHRDPDSLPPRNIFEWCCYQVSSFVIGLGGGNALYALKAGALTVLLCLPNFIRNSAAFAIANRFSWGMQATFAFVLNIKFMGQLSLSRFRGDTTFILVARITSTFLGGIAGMVIWYISTGSGNGNPYGLAATCFVCFPFFFFARLYLAVNQLMNIVFFVTAVLVVGFSYQDQHVVAPGSPGTGYRVFWRRTVLVSAGVTAAFIFSLFPPATTIRRYERRLLATTSAEIGSTCCAILSFANTKREPEIRDIIVSLIALRSKLTRSNALRTNVDYEFSMRGRWPSERYQAVADLQMALAYSLSHLMSVLEHLESSWSRAFLQRTQFMDPDFQGDILAVVSMMSNALRNGTPLPQITPCPLLDRFTYKYHGLDVIHRDSEEDYGLPRNLSMETLKNEQYLMFCVGISIAYGIINRLDKLMLAVKEILGEQYHIHGVGIRPREITHFSSGCKHRNGNGHVRFSGEVGVRPAPAVAH